MSKSGKPRLKKMRRVGADLSLMSGVRPLDSKGKINTRPGMHGAKRTRLSDYGVNLVGKQCVKYTYGVSDKQLLRKHREAVSQMRAMRTQKKETDYGLFVDLESRLDAVVYRIGFAATVVAARKLVVHGKVFVDGARQSKPGLLLKGGEVIEIRAKEKQKGTIQFALDLSKERRASSNWLSLPVEQPKDSFQGTFLRKPSRDELPAALIEWESKVIQFYSK